MSDEYKYGIVRLKKSQMVDFFSIIAAHGFTDVSFVTELSQAIIEQKPNGDALKEAKEEKIESEDQADTCVASPADDRFQQQLNNHLAMMCSVVPKGETSPGFNDLGAQAENGGPSPAPSLRDLEDLAAAASSDLLSNLFGSSQLNLIQTPNSGNNRNSPFKNNQPLQFQTRMKGWQREYIKDVINNGHYPTEDELRDIEQKCDLSRKQVLRFIAKRLVNPNRKPRADWRSDKAADAMAVSPDQPPMLIKEEEEA